MKGAREGLSAGRGGGRAGRREERERQGVHRESFYLVRRQGKSRICCTYHAAERLKPAVGAAGPVAVAVDT